jgi:hypothetical protein
MRFPTLRRSARPARCEECGNPAGPPDADGVRLCERCAALRHGAAVEGRAPGLTLQPAGPAWRRLAAEDWMLDP